ncbi:MFS transporter [Nocardioides litoris]|uniref:MFS transporter n=1 Tax=Nocardioides litoris TaxID=1926648 RepID=UPI00112426DD|nr:MFS transporter [Nocardioides litoris]
MVSTSRTSHPPAGGDATAQDGHHPRLGLLLATMCSALGLVIAATSSLALALPDVAADTGATQSQATWVVNAYALVFAALLLPIGIAADKLGRRGFLVGGLGLFAAATAVSGLLDDPVAVIALRGVAGLGAAAVMPATLSVLVEAFPEDRRDRAVSVWAAVSGAGAMVGLVVAGLLLESFWWGSVQLTTGAAAAVLALVCLRVVPPSRNPDLRLDPAGAVLSLVGLAGIVYAVVEGPEIGWTSPRVVVAAAVGVVALGAFVGHEMRTEAPMLDVRLFRSRWLATGSVLVFLQFFSAYAFFFLGPQWLQYVQGEGPLGAAAWFLPFALGVAPASLLAPVLIDRLGPGTVGAWGMAQMGLALGAVALQADGETSLWWFAATVVVLSFGFGLAVTPGTSLIIGGLPEDRRTLSAAVNDVTREVGGALGSAVAASVLLAVYGARLDGLTGLPGPVAAAAEAGFVQAAGAAGELPPREGARLLSTATDAFGDGFATALWMAAAVLVLGAVATAVGARRR